MPPSNATQNTIAPSPSHDRERERERNRERYPPPPPPSSPLDDDSFPSVPRGPSQPGDDPTKKPAAPRPPRNPPKVIEEDDPLLDYPPESWIASMIGTSGLLYRFSTNLVYKSNVTPREVSLMEAAGSELTLPPVSRVVWKGSRPDVGTKAMIMELGRRFRGQEVPVENRRAVVVEMFLLLEKLHNDAGIVHGDIKEGNFLWGRDGRLRIVDFSSARYVSEVRESWNESFATEAYFTPERMRRREEVKRGTGGGRSSGGGGVPAPTVFDDYYALAVTLWGLFSGRRPGKRQFNQKTIWRTDLAEVEDDMVRAWIKKVFKMAGCRLVWSDPMERKSQGQGVAGPGQVESARRRTGV